MRRALIVAVSLLVAVAGCGSDELEFGDAGPKDDGKLHPAASGQRTTEKLACDALLDAHSKKMLELGCAGTSRVCPSYLRATFNGVMCMQYDQGSVAGCVEYFKAKTTCDEIAAALDDCVITAYPGSEPAGCPTP